MLKYTLLSFVNGGVSIMRKKLSAGIIAAALVLSLSSCSYFEKTVTEKATAEVPPKLVFLGDSIPAGYGLEGYSREDLYQSRSYCNILGQEYKQELELTCGHEMVNLAVEGDTSSQLLEHLSSGEFDEGLADSDAVVISIGGNDILEIFIDYIHENAGYSNGEFNINDVDLWGVISGFGDMEDKLDEALDGYDDNLKQIIDLVREKTSGEIYVQTLYDPFDELGIPVICDKASDKIGRLNDIVNSYANYGSTHFYTVIDLVPAFEGKSEELTNIDDIDIHPNAQGHEVIATLVDEQLRAGSYSYDTQAVVTDKRKVAFAAGGASVCALLTAAGIIVLIRKRRTH